MNTALGAPRDPHSDSTRGSHPSIHEQNDAVGDRNGRTIMPDAAVLAVAADPVPPPQSNSAQEGVRARIHNGVLLPFGLTRGADAPIPRSNEAVGGQSGDTILVNDAVLAGAPDPQIPSQTEAAQDCVLEAVQNGVARPSGSTLGSDYAVHGQSDVSRDRSGRTTMEDAPIIPVYPNVPAVSVALARNGPAGRPGPPTGIRSVRGRRKDMEDAVCAAHRFLSLPSTSPSSDLHYFAVYDGHGGAQVAMHCREWMHLALAEEIQRVATPESIEDREAWESYMNGTFLRMDREVAPRGAVAGAGPEQSSCLAATRSETVGSTAIVAVLSDCHIIIANCGDSRAVLCRRGQAVPLSHDHKPDREDELARIEAAGGRVFNWNGWRVLGVLAMSRAIGDHYLKPYVIADPDMTMTVRSEDDECLILASDGLWDMISNQDACNCARELLAANGGAQTIASTLVQRAYERGSSDNISVVVVDLRRTTENLC